MAKSHSGGGRTEVRTPVRTGAAAKGVNPGYASQIGAKLHQQADRTPMGAAPPYSAVLGNQKALAVGRGRPGADRVVHKTGSQSQHGAPVNPGSPTPREILSEFGPERSKG
jgi:hypothetical protein